MRIDVRGHRPEDVDLGPAVRHLLGGGLMAYPTETVYGLGCLVRQEAMETLRSAKREGSARPFLLLVEDLSGLRDLNWTPEALALADVFWPGALTLVLADPEGVFPPFARGPGNTVALRRTSHPLAASLVEALGEPLTSTSANVPGDLPALSGDGAEAVVESLGLAGQTHVLDVGVLAPSEPSTIVDCTGPTPVVIRAGATPVTRLRCVLPEIHGAF